MIFLMIMNEIIFRGSGNSKEYLDQLDNRTWITSRSLSKYLRSKYDISPEEYYNLVTKGSLLPPRCPICGRSLKWKNPNGLSGYLTTCGDTLCRYKSANKEFNLTIERRRGTPEGIGISRSISSRLKDLHKAGIYDVTKSINSFIGTINRHYSNLMNLDKSATTYFYIVEVSGQIKFGVTQDIRNRSKYYGSDLVIMYEGSLLIAAELERFIKLERNDCREYLPISQKSYLINLINAGLAQLVEH